LSKKPLGVEPKKGPKSLELEGGNNNKKRNPTSFMGALFLLFFALCSSFFGTLSSSLSIWNQEEQASEELQAFKPLLSVTNNQKNWGGR
jgi:hypothetical protein